MDEAARTAAVDLLKQRYSCRAFQQDRPIEDEVLDSILEVGLNAASGGNIQAVSIIRVRDSQQRDRIHTLLPRNYVTKADVLLFYVLDYYRMMRWAEVEKAPFGRQYSFRDFMIEVEDVMCVAQSIECAATLMGIGSVYVGTVNRFYDELKEILELPRLTVPILLSCMGYPAESGKRPRKLSRELMVHEERYRVLSDEDVQHKIVMDKYDGHVGVLSDEHIEETREEFRDIAAQVNGDAWAAEVVNRVQEQRGINKAQNTFCLHYNPIRQHSYNEKMFEFFKSQGLHMLPGDDWFRRGPHISE